ncbi:MAG TPA: ABC transporter permease subunit, partial [Actinomycetota bacterium]|nr:ABC transporter permease subunit [Actinomycetota bacterium]
MADTRTPVGPPFWRDVRVLRIAGQAVFLALVGLLLYWLYLNLVTNLRRQGITPNYGFLSRPAGFRVSGSAFSSRESVWSAVLVGVRNTALVSGVGILLATVLGLVVGVARLSTNWLVRRGASLYVETFRNIPVLILILFMFKAVTLRLPPVTDPIELPGLVMANSGLWIPWVSARPGAGAFVGALGAGAAAAVAVAIWRTRVQDRTGRPHH